MYAKVALPWGPAEVVAEWELPRVFGGLRISDPWGVDSVGRIGPIPVGRRWAPPPLPTHPAAPELPSEMSGRGSNPRLVSFYKEIKHTDGSSILYLKGRKRILRAGAGSQQTRSDPGNEGPNKAASGQPLASSRKGGPAAARGNGLSDVREHPWPSRSSKQPLPRGAGRLLTAEILEEVCRVAPADPLPQAGHVVPDRG